MVVDKKDLPNIQGVVVVLLMLLLLLLFDIFVPTSAHPLIFGQVVCPNILKC